MAEFFSQSQIDKIRECFNLYCTDDELRSAAQMRCILRSLGYSPTAQKTVEYFEKYRKRSMAFSTFLEIAKEEHMSSDPLTDIIKALRGFDRKGTKSMTSNELRAVLSSIGERLSPQEIDHLLSRVEINGIVPHQKLIEYISK